jgi:hypothetical protein
MIVILEQKILQRYKQHVLKSGNKKIMILWNHQQG